MQRLFSTACLMLCFLMGVPVWAQRIVTGTVSDISNEPLTGVSVVVKEQKNLGGLTDLNGRYKLSLPDDNREYTLEVSYLGYELQRQKTGTKKPAEINFLLKESQIDLDVVVITGTRTPKLLKDAPIITKVITENDLRKVDVTNIGELLQTELPGIELSYKMNQQTSLNMQGFGGNAVLFLVDGERVAGETLDNIDYSRLNLDNVERIEIIKGAASSLYGSNAVGGVINIISKVPTEPWAVNVNSRIARPHDQPHNGYEQRHGGTISFNNGRWSNTLNIQYVHADSVHLNNKLDVSSDSTFHNRVHAYRNWNIKERVRYSYNGLILTGNAGFFFRERESADDKYDRYRGYNAGVKGEYNINDKNSVELSYAFDQYDKSDYMVGAGTDLLKYSNVQHNVRALYHYSFGEKNIITVGGDYMRDYLMSYQFNKGGGSHRQYVADLFGQLDWTPFEKFNVIAGVRYDYFSDNDISRVSPKIGMMYKLGRVTLRGSYAAGFRAPTLKEKYMEFDMAGIFDIYGNTHLKSESSHNFSISGEYTKSYYNFSLTGYYNLVDNRINTIWNEELNGQEYVNNERVNVVGADINASAKFPCGINARLSYTFTHEYADKENVLLTSTRPHTANARLGYDKSWKNYGFNVSLSGRILSKVRATESAGASNEIIRHTYPGYTLWKLSLVQHIYRGIHFSLAVDNLFNYVPSIYNNNSAFTTGPEFSAGVSIDIQKLFR